MIDELCEQFGCSRKHAIKLLNAHTGWGGDPAGRNGRPPEYGPEVGARMASVVSSTPPARSAAMGCMF